MTKLEEEMKKAMRFDGNMFDEDVTACAEVAKRYIEKALRDASMTNYAYKKTYQQAAKEWLTENGIE
jgi:hypothetical protein